FVLRAFELLGGPLASGIYRELLSPVGSLRELDQMARSAEMSWVSVRMLSHPHPHFRYVAATRVKLEQVDSKRWIEALLAERSAIIRRVIAKTVASGLNPPSASLEADRIAELVELVPEAAYLVEVWGLSSVRDVRVPLAFNLRTLAFLDQGGPTEAIAFVST